VADRAYSSLAGCRGIFVKALIQKRYQEALLKSERRLAEAQRIAHLGNWEWDIIAGDLHFSDEVCEIFGLLPDEFGKTYEAFLASVHPMTANRCNRP